MSRADRAVHRRTVAAYEAHATAYAVGTAPMGARRGDIEDFAARLPAGARVLEIGSGPGLDARGLEDCGLRVRRTDITPAFVAMLRAGGYPSDLVDPLTDELVPDGAEPYDAVWSNACLLHLQRDDLPTVLARLRDAVHDRGLLFVSLKEGDGAQWSNHGHVAAPRFFTFWREEPLRAVLTRSGWAVEDLRRSAGLRDVWLDVVARAATP